MCRGVGFIEMVAHQGGKEVAGRAIRGEGIY